MVDRNDRVLPLTGVRILSQAIVWAGPYATLILADLGADVIEIESIQHLNPTRTQFRHLPPQLMDGPSGAPYVDRDPSEGFWDRQAFFNYGKRGCRSITLDLSREEGREVCFALAREADVFIENNAADVVGDLGIGWEALSAANPRLSMIRFPGFGISGPYRDFKGYGATMEAVVGHTMLRGYRDADPSATPSIYHGDPNAGAHVAFAVQAALYARERTGRGQLVDLSQAEAVIHHTAYALMDYQMNGRVMEHPGNTHPSMAPYGVFPAAGEDRWVAIAIPTDRAFGALAREMGRPELAADPRYATVVERYRHQQELEPLIAAWTAPQPYREVMERLQRAGVPATMVYRQEELLDDPHLAGRDYFVTLDHPAAGRHRYAGPAVHFERQPLRPVRSPAPTLGQHNHELITGLLGRSEEEYRRLVEAAVVGDRYLETAT